MSDLQLKSIAPEAVPRALERAERYRLLNEPRLAESICLDVLLLQPDNQKALSCLLLAVTDQFGYTTGPLQEQAKRLLPRFNSPYERVYYAGIIKERFGLQQLQQGHPGSKFSAYEYLHEAIELYDEADAIAPQDNDDAILRRNTCVRMIEWHRLTAPHRDEHEQPLE
jgi:hypothetical protein